MLVQIREPRNSEFKKHTPKPGTFLYVPSALVADGSKQKFFGWSKSTICLTEFTHTKTNLKNHKKKTVFFQWTRRTKSAPGTIQSTRIELIIQSVYRVSNGDIVLRWIDSDRRWWPVSVGNTARRMHGQRCANHSCHEQLSLKHWTLPLGNKLSPVLRGARLPVLNSPMAHLLGFASARCWLSHQKGVKCPPEER